MNANKLEPCPFCGKTNYLIMLEASHKLGDIILKQYTVVCDASGDKLGCGASCGFKHSEQEAVEAWNRCAYTDSSHIKKEDMWSYVCGYKEKINHENV